MMALHWRGAAALALVGVVGLWAIACGSDKDGDTPGGGGETQQGKDGEPLFRALEADLVKTCGGANGQCHVNGTFQKAPTWLANPDPYLSAKRYRGIIPITKEVGDSILLTQIAHAGPALKSTPGLYEKVADWLNAEVVPPPLPNSGAFSVQNGFNNINLNTAGDGLEGARVTFVASDENNVLKLSAITFYAPQNANVNIDSPFFVILPRSGKVNANVDNGFKGMMTVPAGKNAVMFTGEVIILRWDPTGQLKLVFQALTTTPGQGASQSCTALDQFKSSALPAMRMLRDVYADDDAGAVVGQNSCIGCHAAPPPQDEGPSPAVQAMDLRDVDTKPEDACAQARNWINFQDKSKSSLILNPTGAGNPQHPMKPIPMSDDIIKGLQGWINAERQ